MSLSFARAAATAAAAAILVTLPGCAETRYLLQAAPGQLELYSGSRPLADVIADEGTDERTRVLLGEVDHIREFAGKRGLRPKGNYGHYVDLKRSAVVYFLAASRPLAFEPKLWSFPLVGSFPYTGWFSYWAARDEARRLDRGGWDVYIRPVRAYSTGGWLRDPVLSTMLLAGDDAFRYLIGVILHELVHANFFVPDQATFNESLASFVGDQMADHYIAARFGADSEELATYREELADYERRSALLRAAYSELEALYGSSRTDADKLAAKARILRRLRNQADLRYQPNNASLIGFKTYNSGLDELAALFARCERSWPRFFARIETIERDDFPEEQLEELGAFIEEIIAGGCPAKR